MIGALARRWRQIALTSLVLLSVSAIPVVGQEPQITDPEHDAYSYPGPLNQVLPKPPNPLLSNDTADLLAVMFSTAPAQQAGHDRAYTVSVRTRGEPNAGYTYVVGGSFGEECFLVHQMQPGKAGPAFLACRAGDTYRPVGSIAGSVASVTGGTVSVTYSFRTFTMHSQLRNDPELERLYAFACPAEGCRSDAVIDSAFSETSKFKV